MKIEIKISELLKKQGKSLAIAESATGGLLCHKITNISGSSKYFKLGIVAYSNEFKKKLLNIPQNLLKTKGAVSAEACLLLAQNVRRLAKTDFGIGITGIAGPTGSTAKKPIGLVYVAISAAKKSLVKKFIFEGTRLSIKNQSANSALKLLEKLL